MKIGVGLPSHIANAPAPLTIRWARHAEQRGLGCVSAIDRFVYPRLAAVIALALAAGAHAAGRYDRATTTVEEITGTPSETAVEFVAAHRDLFPDPGQPQSHASQ